jgi:hypothetical protein
MKIKILWCSVASVLIIGLAVAAILWLRRPQVLTMSDGTKLTLLKVDYGMHHAPPKLKITGPRMGGPTSFDTTNNTLVVWILTEHKPNQWPNFEVLACDEAATACVANNWSGNSQQINEGMDVRGIELNAFPRRDRKFYLRISNWGQRGRELLKGRFVISNPARGSFPQWAPGPLPATQSDGDLDVTLTRLVYGVRGFNGGKSDDLMDKAVRAAFHTEQKGVVVTNWQPLQIETSDATGNRIFNNSWSATREQDEAVMTYQWGLWPGEPAWKLRVEMSRTSGFNSNETWTVTDIPLQPGSQQDIWNYNGRRNRKPVSPFAEATLNGIHLKILPAIRVTDQTQGGQKPGGFHLQADPEPEQMRLTLDITDDRGRRIQTTGSSINNGFYSYQLADLRNAKTLSVTIALHKSRFVEFTVKPQKPTAADAR